MKKFLEIILQILQDSELLTKKPEESLEQQLSEEFKGLQKKDIKEVYIVLKEICADDIKMFLLLLSYIIQVTKSVDFLVEFYELLLSSSFDTLDKIDYSYQLDVFIFTEVKLTINPILFEFRKKIFDAITDEVRKKINISRDYIQYQKRNKKRVVLLIQPLLLLSHAPTLTLVNLVHYFEQCGYEVKVVSDSLKKIYLDRSFGFWMGRYMNSLFDDTQIIKLNYNNQIITGKHWEHTDENFYDNTRNQVYEILDYNPEFVLSIGERNILEAICSKYTTVVAMGGTANPPIAGTNFIRTPAQKELMSVYENYELLDFCIDFEIDPYGEKINRKDVGLTDDIFIAAIVGTRLDREITNDFIERINKIIDKNKNFAILVIGKCSTLKNKIQQSEYKDNYIFIGHSDKIRNMISVCDLYINPPRQGGGLSAKCAMECDVPVITLGECDVANNVGEKFVVNSVEEMCNEIDKCIHNTEYYEAKKNYCKIAKNKWKKIDNLGNIRQFCNEVERITLKREGK